MAKFCTNCGKKLNDGEVCDCTKDNEIMNNEIVQKVISVFKGMIYTPIDTMKDFIKKSNFVVGMVFAGILSIIAALFAMACLKNGATVSGYYNLYGIARVEIPYAKTFFTTLVVVFAVSFVYSAILYVVNTQLFKRECDFKEVYTMFGVSSTVFSMFLALAIILLFVNMVVGVVVASFGTLLFNVYCYHGLKFLGSKDENKYGYIYLTTYIIFLIVVYIFTKIFS